MSSPTPMALILCLAGAPMAAAQGAGLTFEPSGRLSFGASDRVTGADIFLYGDATLRLSSDALPLGIEVGAYGLADALDTPHETYAAVTWDLAGGGRVSLGVPRPAYDGFAVSALETQFPSLAVARSGGSRSLATTGAMFGNFLPYGARYDQTRGDLRLALSVHEVTNFDRTIAGFGAAYDLGDWTVSGAVEIAWGSSTDVAVKIRAEGGSGPVTGGVGIFAPGTVGGPELIEGFAAFQPMDRVTLSGVVQAPLDGSDPTGGITARYDIRKDLSVTAGVLSDAGSQAAFSAHLDWNF